MMPLEGSGSGVDLAALVAGMVQGAVPSRSIGGIAMDSRAVRPGWLFVAVPGADRHGLDYLPQALERGAAAVVVEPGGDWPHARIAALAVDAAVPVLRIPGLRRRASDLAGRFFRHPGGDLDVIGVTGTNGKTSVTHFLAQALASDLSTAVIGTLGNGLPGALTPSSHTTPDAVTLQAELARMRDQCGAAAVAMEVSSHGLDQYRVAAIPFQTAVFTNLSRDHLDYHGSLAAYGEAKAVLFRCPDLQLAVVDSDFELGREILSWVEAPSIAVGRDPVCRGLGQSYVHLRQARSDNRGLLLEYESSWGGGRIAAPLFGDFNADNLLPVIGILLRRGLTPTEVGARIAALQPIPGRMEAVAEPGKPLVVIDYAHTPDALEQALRSVRAHCTGSLVCVFGCGGERDAGKRPLMGRVAERLADVVIVTDDNPRHEDGDRIVADIVAGLEHPRAVRIVRQRAQAIAQALAAAGADGLALIAGKGHEAVQIVGDLQLDFSDRDAARKALQEWTA